MMLQIYQKPPEQSVKHLRSVLAQMLPRKKVLLTLSPFPCQLVQPKGAARLGWVQEHGRSSTPTCGSGGSGSTDRPTSDRVSFGKILEGKIGKEGLGPCLLPLSPHYLGKGLDAVTPKVVPST